MEINKENIKNPTSLYREDNPALFDAIVKSAELESIGNELTQQQLEKITKLTVDNNIGSAYGFNEKGEYVELTGRISRGDLPPSLTTLNGLEKLKNLESFKVVVKERYLNIDEYFYEYSRYLERMYEPEYKNKIEEMVFTTLNKVLKRDYHNTEEFKKAQAEVFKNFEKYDKFNQITDFTALSQCKKLKKLDLSRQRYLTSLDLYNLKNLSSLDLSNCENLSDIYNLSELNAFREDGQSTTININFGDCYKLINISDIDKLSKQLAQNEYNKDNCTVIVPTTSFCHLSKKYPEAMQLLNKISQSDKSRDVFLWTEAWDSVRQCSKINTEQMQILKNRANEIVSSINANQKDNSDWSRISNAYRYICDNIYYDSLKLNKAKNEKWHPDTFHNKEQPTVAETIYGEISSSYQSILQGKGICVGLSNAYNLLLAEMGYIAEPCLCKGKKSKEIEWINRDDHQISRMQIKDNETGNTFTYYFDPTWDCAGSGGSKSKYFALTKEEMKKDHAFTSEDIYVTETPSLQEELKDNGYLKSRYKGHTISRTVNATKGLVNDGVASVYGVGSKVAYTVLDKINELKS